MIPTDPCQDIGDLKVVDPDQLYYNTRSSAKRPGYLRNNLAVVTHPKKIRDAEWKEDLYNKFQ